MISTLHPGSVVFSIHAPEVKFYLDYGLFYPIISGETSYSHHLVSAKSYVFEV